MKAHAVMLAGLAGLGGLAGLTWLLASDEQSSSREEQAPMPQTMTKSAFVQRLLPKAIELERSYGLDRRVLLAQAALESSWGRRAPGNMLFGVKWTNAYALERRQLLTTWEAVSNPAHWREGGRQVIRAQKRNGVAGWVVKDWFMRYDSWEHCLDEHVGLLAKRWPGAFRVDPAVAADVLAGKGGGPRYATDPNYAASLKAVIASLPEANT